MRNTRKPIVSNGGLQSVSGEMIQIGTPLWFAWLEKTGGFCYEGNGGHFTARRETRRGISYWYAYRRRGGKLAKTYLGKSDHLYSDRLEQASAYLAGKGLARSRQWRSDRPIAPDWMATASDAAAPSVAAARPDSALLPLTKFSPPALPQKFVARSRLTQRINAPVTLVCAPSGFGKTTLLNEWRQSCGLPVAWMSLDADDNQLWRFWTGFLIALRTVRPDLGRDLMNRLHVSLPAHTNDLIAALTNALVQQSDESEPARCIALVLDDYHHIQNQSIHQMIQLLLGQLPPTLRLVISTHVRPPLSLGYLRSKGWLAELDTDDVRFTVKEGLDFFSQCAPDIPLGDVETRALVKRTEGWAAGLNLASLALARQPSSHQWMARFTGDHAYLREYFVENILHRQPLSVQAFMLKTSILAHLRGDLCDALTGQTNGEEMLRHLWQDNLFVTRLEEQDLYRYHDLFAQVLRSQLQLQFPSELPRLHRQAAQWYSRHGLPADAVHHLLAIGAWEDAASLIERMALEELKEYGEDSRLLRWLRELPESVVTLHKTLLFVYTRLAVYAFPLADVEQFLSRAQATIASKPIAERTSDEQQVLAEIQRIRGLWATGSSAYTELQTVGGTDETWQIMDRLFSTRFAKPEPNDRDVSAIRAVYEMAQAGRNLFVMLMAGARCAAYLLRHGYLRRAEKIGHQVLDQVLAQRGRLPEPASMTLTTLSRICYERNQLTQAHRLLLRAVEVDPNPTSTNMPVRIAVTRARVESARGNHKTALSIIQSALQLNTSRPSSMWTNEDLVAYQALFSLQQGDCALAEQLLVETHDAAAHPLGVLIRAEILVELEQFADAEPILDQLVAEYPDGLPNDPILPAYVLFALTLFQEHKFNSACRVMTEALRRAAPEGFIRPFLNRGTSIVPLLLLVLRTERFTAETESFVKEILHLLEYTDRVGKTWAKTELEALSTAASISPRELGVLRLVSAGLSNKEIGSKLFITESTVQSHLFNIYRKLGVKSRMQAVAQVRALDLL